MLISDTLMLKRPSLFPGERTFRWDVRNSEPSHGKVNEIKPTLMGGL